MKQSRFLAMRSPAEMRERFALPLHQYPFLLLLLMRLRRLTLKSLCEIDYVRRTLGRLVRLGRIRLRAKS